MQKETGINYCGRRPLQDETDLRSSSSVGEESHSLPGHGDKAADDKEPQSSNEAFLQLREQVQSAVQCSTHHSHVSNSCTSWSSRLASADTALPSMTCLQCAARDRMYLEKWRRAAQDNATIYSVHYLNVESSSTTKFCCCSAQWLGELLICLVAFSIQTIFPIAIIWNFFDDGNTVCPKRASPVLRFLAFMLSVLFAIVSYLVCEGKLRALLFLYRFCPIKGRGSILLFGIAGNLIGMMTASSAQFFLFMAVDPFDTERLYLTMLFVSLTMQATLQMDSRLVSSAQAALVEKVAGIIGSDDLILGGAGMQAKKASKVDGGGAGGEILSTMPRTTAIAVDGFRRLTDTMTVFLLSDWRYPFLSLFAYK